VGRLEHVKGTANTRKDFFYPLGRGTTKKTAKKQRGKKRQKKKKKKCKNLCDINYGGCKNNRGLSTSFKENEIRRGRNGACKCSRGGEKGERLREEGKSHACLETVIVTQGEEKKKKRSSNAGLRENEWWENTGPPSGDRGTWR